jgi:hypothetical protein
MTKKESSILQSKILGMVTFEDLISILIEQSIITGALIVFISVVYFLQITNVPRIIGW